MVHGEWIYPEGPNETTAGVRILTEPRLPVIFDGGCAIVNVVYDVDIARVISVMCNGRA